ncbi:MAG TPA: carbohydrate ABC transporter permease [Peptococcaceae bacterium]|nr:carbohydrate ABC transporter permease [Peptococcaceae bacterium]
MKIVGKITSWLGKIFLYFWCIFSLFSLIWVAISALKTNRELFGNPWGMAEKLQFSNFAKVWSSYNLSQNFYNSVVVVAFSVIFILIICTPASYVLSRVNFRGRGFLSFLFTAGMGIPYQLLLIPLYFIMFRVGLTNTLGGLVIVYVALSIPFTIFLMLGFFRTLPSVLEEAALIDGCTPIQTFFRIMLPLGRPAVITASIFNFLSLWNEFLLALVFTNDDWKFTLSVGLNALQTSMQYTGDWVALFAGIVVVIIPTLIVYLLLSRRIIEGLTLGAVKE